MSPVFVLSKFGALLRKQRFGGTYLEAIPTAPQEAVIKVGKLGNVSL